MEKKSRRENEQSLRNLSKKPVQKEIQQKVV